MVELSRLPNLVLVPSVAVEPQASESVSYVVKPDNTVEARTVTMALQVGDEVGISAGLAAGEVVVTEGQGTLSDGAKVTVAAPDAGTTATCDKAAKSGKAKKAVSA